MTPCAGAVSPRGKGEPMSTDPDDDSAADWSEQELSVLRSAELDAPPHGALDRTLAAIGVGAALGAGVAVGTASSVGSAAQVGRVAHGSMWLKWASAGLVGCGIAGALLLHRHSATRGQTPVSLNAAPRAAPSVPKSDPPSAVAAPSALPALAPSPAAAVPAPSTPSSQASAPARADNQDKPDGGKDALAAEIRMIDEAREQLRHGDPQSSLKTLAEYDQLVKRGGSMRAEATVVRIEAYQASGDAARATALGQRFLLNNPSSPYADYVKRILSRAD